MKKFIFLIISILISIIIKAKTEGSNEKQECFYLNFVGKTQDIFEFEIINNSTDSLFLFDSYFNEETTAIINKIPNAKYLHRFDTKSKQCKLSFLPLLPFLSVDKTDVIVFGENSVVRKGQILFHFKIISPQSKTVIKLPKESFYQTNFIKEIYPKKLSKFDNKINVKDIYNTKCKYIIVEFAVYKNIDIFRNKDAYYYDEFNFNTQALSYKIISIPVKLEKSFMSNNIKHCLIIIIIFVGFNLNVQAKQSIYLDALNEINTMLLDSITLDFKKAVFLTENAYFEGELKEEGFNYMIEYYSLISKEIMISGDITYAESDKEKASYQCAVFIFLTTPTPMTTNEEVVVHPPFSYNYDDFAGQKDWANTLYQL